MIGKCCACDVRLTVEQCRTDAEMCPGCRREQEEGYAANRAALLWRLIVLLKFHGHFLDILEEWERTGKPVTRTYANSRQTVDILYGYGTFKG